MPRKYRCAQHKPMGLINERNEVFVEKHWRFEFNHHWTRFIWSFDDILNKWSFTFCAQYQRNSIRTMRCAILPVVQLQKNLFAYRCVQYVVEWIQFVFRNISIDSYHRLICDIGPLKFSINTKLSMYIALLFFVNERKRQVLWITLVSKRMIDQKHMLFWYIENVTKHLIRVFARKY